MKVVANTVASAPIAMTPLSKLPFGHVVDLREGSVRADAVQGHARRHGAPRATQFTGVHVASMSINLGNVLRFFGKADQPGLMNAIVGTPTPWGIIRNLPRMVARPGDEAAATSSIARAAR